MDAKADRPLTIRLTDLMSDDTLLHGKVGFWKRQFQLRPTTGQRTFDVLFGVLTPLLCLILDPGILRQGSISVEPFLENWSVYVHTEIAIGLFLLCFFLAFQRASPILAGALLGCGVFSLLLGLFQCWRCSQKCRLWYLVLLLFSLVLSLCGTLAAVAVYHSSRVLVRHLTRGRQRLSR